MSIVVLAGCGASEDLPSSATVQTGALQPDEVTIGPSGKDMNYYQCALEGGTCSVGGGDRYMAFGANGAFVFKLLNGTVSCQVSTFGSDPAVGVTKSCYISNYGASLPLGTGMVPENQTATADGNVAYGANGAFFFQTFHGAFTCNNATFGDPIPGVVKACYIAAPAYTRVAGEGETITGLANTPVAFGAGGRFVYALGGPGGTNFSWPCAVGSPGFAYDPAPGVVKDCYKLTNGHRGTSSLRLMANDGQNWTTLTSQVTSVFYGSGRNGNFIVSNGFGSSGACSAQLGDPDPGQAKFCFNAPVPGRQPGTWTRLQNDLPSEPPPPVPCQPAPAGVESITLMPDGSVMVNPINQFTHWYRLTAGPSGGYVDGTWTRVADSHLGRHAYPAMALRDGRLLVCGGEFIADQNNCPLPEDPGGCALLHNQCEIFDPNSGPQGTWTVTTPFSVPSFPQECIVDGVMARLPDGKILVGGVASTHSMEFDPTHATDSLAWTAPETAYVAPGDPDDRPFCEGSLATLQDGTVLLAEVGYDRYNQAAPLGMRWSTPLSPPALNPFGDSTCGGTTGEGASDLTLYDGRVLILGASSNNAIFDPATSAVQNVSHIPQVFPGTYNVGNMGQAHELSQSVMPNGHVLVAASSQYGFVKFFEYDPANDVFWDVSYGASPALTEGNNTHGGFPVSETLLPDGSVLVGSSDEMHLYVYRPFGAQLTTYGQPTIARVSGPLATGEYTLVGTTLNGLTNGSNRDDEGSNSTAFPVVSVTAGSTTRYAVVTSVNSTSTAPGAPVTVRFRAPRAGWPGSGALTVRTSASGLMSASSATITAPQQMQYRGGPVLSPRIACLLWGSWTSDDKAAMENYITGLQHWMSNEHSGGGLEPAIRQYGVWGAYFPGPCAVDTVMPAGVTVDPQSSSFQTALQNEIARAQDPANGIGLEGYTNESVFLVFTKGIPTASTFGAGSWCGFHNTFGAGQYYGVIPDQSGTCGGSDPSGALQTMASHELFEAATDTDLSSGWFGSDTGNEIGDGCPGGYILTLPNGTFGSVSQVADNATETCQWYSPPELLPVSVVKTGTNTINVFAQDINGGLQQIVGDGVNWGPPTVPSGAGVIPDAPSAMSVDGQTIDVFSRGLDGGLWRWFFDGSSWSGPSALGGFIIGPPSAVYRTSQGRLIYARGTDGNIWVMNDTGGFRWQVAATLPGGVLAVSPPQAFQRSSDCVDVYTSGTNGHLYWMSNCSDVAFWTDMGDTVLNRVSQATHSTNSSRTDIFVNGPTTLYGALPFHMSVNPSSGLTYLGSTVMGGTSAVPLGSSAIRLLARGPGGRSGATLLEDVAPTGSDFGGWTQIDSTLISEAPLAFTPDGTTVNVFLRRQKDGELVQKRFDGTSYQPVQDLLLQLR
jgi:hypothetical protein